MYQKDRAEAILKDICQPFWDKIDSIEAAHKKHNADVYKEFQRITIGTIREANQKLKDLNNPIAEKVGKILLEILSDQISKIASVWHNNGPVSIPLVKELIDRYMDMFNTKIKEIIDLQIELETKNES